MKTYFISGYILESDIGEYNKRFFSEIVTLDKKPSDIKKLKATVAKKLNTRFKITIKCVSKL